MNIGEVLVKIGADVSGLNQGVNQAKSSIDTLSGAAKTAATAFAGFFAAQKVLGFGADTLRTFGAAEDIWSNLGGALRGVGVEMGDVRAEIDAAARSMQDMTRMGDEDFAASLANLTRLSGDYAGSMERMQLVADLAAARNMDFGQASELVGRAMAGNTAQLERMFPALRGSSDALGDLAQQMQGEAARAAQTFNGQLAQTANEWGDIKEALGGFLVQSGNGASAMQMLTQGLRTVNVWLSRNSESIAAFAQGVVQFGVTGAEGLYRFVHGLNIVGNGIIVGILEPLNAAARAVNRLIEAGNRLSGLRVPTIPLLADPARFRANIAGSVDAIRGIGRETENVAAAAGTAGAAITSKIGGALRDAKADAKALAAEVKRTADLIAQMARLQAPQLAFRVQAPPQVGGQTLDPGTLARVAEQFRRLDETTAALDLTLRQVDRSAKLGVQATGRSPLATAGASAMDALKGGAMDLLRVFSPMAMLGELVNGVLQHMGPQLEKLQEPLGAIANILATVLAPVLEVVAWALRGVVKAVSYLIEGLGRAVRAIGKLIDALPFVSGGPIIRAGEAMIEFADATRKAAEGQKALADEAKRAATNIPPIFDLVGRRRQVAAGVAGGGAAAPAPSGPGIEVHIHNPPSAVDPIALAKQVERGLIEGLRRGGTTELSLAVRAL